MSNLHKDIIDIDKRNSSKRGVSFYQCHRGHVLRFKYMFIESPKIVKHKSNEHIRKNQ